MMDEDEDEDEDEDDDDDNDDDEEEEEEEEEDINETRAISLWWQNPVAISKAQLLLARSVGKSLASIFTKQQHTHIIEGSLEV